MGSKCVTPVYWVWGFGPSSSWLLSFGSDLVSPCSSAPFRWGRRSCLGLRTGVSPHFSMNSVREILALRGGYERGRIPLPSPMPPESGAPPQNTHPTMLPLRSSPQHSFSVSCLYAPPSPSPPPFSALFSFLGPPPSPPPATPPPPPSPLCHPPNTQPRVPCVVRCSEFSSPLASFSLVFFPFLFSHPLYSPLYSSLSVQWFALSHQQHQRTPTQDRSTTSNWHEHYQKRSL